MKLSFDARQAELVLLKAESAFVRSQSQQVRANLHLTIQLLRADIERIYEIKLSDQRIPKVDSQVRI